MSSTFNGVPWEKEAERRARSICVRIGQPEALWEMCLIEANQSMMDDLADSDDETND